MSSRLILTAAAAILTSSPTWASPMSGPDVTPPAAGSAQVIPIAPKPAAPTVSTASMSAPDVDVAPADAPPRPGAPPKPDAPMEMKDLAALAASDPQLSTLAAALRAADLEGTLKGPGPFTLFAPSNEAFSKLPPGTLDDLLKPANKARLVRLLTYHVVPAAMLTADVTGATAAPASVAGPTLAVDGRNGLMVNGARVVGSQTMASNGVIHVIDTVLEPRGS